MSETGRAARAALVVMAGALMLGGATPTAEAQRPRVGTAATAGPRRGAPYPGSRIGVNPGRQGGRQPLRLVRPPRGSSYLVPPVVYYPAPGGYPYYPSYPSGGYGGHVYDATGRPLYDGSNDYDRSRSEEGRSEQSRSEPGGYAPGGNEPPLGGPDLTGSPYQVVRGGMMVVDFGNGDRRTVPACAVLDAERTPDGRPRTIFYRPPADALILRAGARGRVHGAPPAGARVCYAADRYGREVLEY